MSGQVTHFEINGPNGEALSTFYAELFGWHVQAMPEMNYGLVDPHAGAGIGGGIGATPDGGKSITFYVEVPDPQATLDKVESLGGKTVMPVTEIPNVVTLAQFADPQGNVIGITKEEQGQEGGPSAGSNPPVDWFEILEPDATAAWAFYREVFGWQIKEGGGEGFAYGEVEGIGKGIPGGIGSHEHTHVTVYARVDDLAKCLERAESLGGKTAMQPMKVGEGLEVAVFTDPGGNGFGIYRSNR